MTSLRLTSLALALCAVHATGAQAATGVHFDPTGSGSGGTLISGLDWNTTSFLARDGMNAIRNFLARSGPTTFDVYSHASLSAFQLDSNAISVAGLNDSFEVTMILGLGFQVTSVQLSPVGALATFALTPGAKLSSGSDPFLRVYHDTDTGTFSNALSGSGFAEGSLLLASSTVTRASAGVNLSFDTSIFPTTNLDRTTNGDQWAGQQTVQATGSNGIIEFTDVFGTNTNFFTSGPSNLIINVTEFSFNGVSTLLPFTNADPSDCFNLVGSFCAADGVSDPRRELGDGPLIPDIGLVNGDIVSGGADFLAQSDFSSTFESKVVPVPAAVWLLGSALAGGLTVTRRRRAA